MNFDNVGFQWLKFKVVFGSSPNYSGIRAFPVTSELLRKIQHTLFNSVAIFDKVTVNTITPTGDSLTPNLNIHLSNLLVYNRDQAGSVVRESRSRKILDNRNFRSDLVSFRSLVSNYGSKKLFFLFIFL